MGLKSAFKQPVVRVTPNDWKTLSIAEAMCKIMDYRGRTPLKLGMDWGGGDIPALSAGNVKKGFIDFTQECYFGSDALYKKWMTNGVTEANDIVFTTEAPLGNVALLLDNRRYILSQRTILLRVNSDILFAPFLFQLILSDSFQCVLSENSTGSTAKGIKRKKFEKLNITFPPFHEQCAVAGALSDVDALIGALDTALAKKRDLKQAAMQQLLTGQKRLPNFHGNWDEKCLMDVAHITRGASPRPIDSPIWFDEKSSIGWVRISDVTRAGMFLSETSQRLSALGVKSSRPVSKGSLIMSICATVGRPVITKIDTCIHDGFVVFDSLNIDQRLLYYVLKSIERDWGKHGQTGSQMNLNTGLINRTKIVFPKDIAEQTAIAEVLSDMDVEIAALEQRRDKTRALKQGMMQELLTGRIRLI